VLKTVGIMPTPVTAQTLYNIYNDNRQQLPMVIDDYNSQRLTMVIDDDDP